MKKLLVLAGVVLLLCAHISLAKTPKSQRPQNLAKAKIALDFGDDAIGEKTAASIQEFLARENIQIVGQGIRSCERHTIVLCIMHQDEGNPQQLHPINVIVFIPSNGNSPLTLTEGTCMVSPGEDHDAIIEGLVELQLLDKSSRKHHSQVKCHEKWLPSASAAITNTFGL